MASTTVEPDNYAERGAPSYVWREGQQRRLDMIRKWSNLANTYVLVDGCGVGMYAARLLEDTPHVYGFDIEHERVLTARQRASAMHVAAAEYIPYPSNSFETLLSHEVIEHVNDDYQSVAEMARVLKPGGRIVMFCPNRWYPFETHGHYWRGTYYFGNTPFINYLPNAMRNKLAPHVRAYSKHDLLALLDGLPLSVVYHTRIFGGYDNIIARFPTIGKLLRANLYQAEKTPLRFFGLSHLLIAQKDET